MTGSHLERRAFLLGGLRAAVACATSSFFVAEGAEPEGSFQPVFGPLDEFIAQYMRVQSSPGLTLALANSGGTVRTAAFGFSDLEIKAPVTPDLLFEIGSITKSFVALTLLQLREEGKVRLGAHVKVSDEEGHETEYRLVTPDEADPTHGAVSVESPLGRALLGKSAGDDVTVERPRGAVEYTVEAVWF